MPLELLRFDGLLPAFALVLARIGGLVHSLPLLTSQQIPRIVKVWTVITLSLVAFPVVSHLLPESLTIGQAVAGMVGEFIVGEILGLGVGLVFFAVQISGRIVSHQSGMALSQAYDPVSNASSTVLAQLWFFAALMLFLAMDGHLAVIKAVLHSFEKVPPMMMFVDIQLADFIIGVLQSIFETALRLAGPIILALLLTSLIMGFLTKTMPQLNILSVGFSFKIVTGWIMLAVTITFSQEIIIDGVLEGLERVGLLFEDLSEAVIHAR